MKQSFDPSDPDALEAALAQLSRDEVPLAPAFRDRLLADAARVTRPAPARPLSRLGEWLGLAGLPAAALAGAWIGLVNPTVVDQVTPWQGAVTDTEEDSLIDEVFGLGWVALEDTE